MTVRAERLRIVEGGPVREPAQLVGAAARKAIAAAVRHVAMQRSLDGACRIAGERAADLVNARFILAAIDDGSSGRRGIAGVAASTRAIVRVERGDADPRYERERDDPRGDGSERLIFCPLVGPSGVTLAVLAGARVASEPPFDEREAAVLSMFAQHIAPLVAALRLDEWDDDEVTVVRSGGIAALASGAFHREAVERHVAGARHGEVLDVPPLLPRAGYAGLALLVLAALVSSVVVRIHRHAAGPAVIVARGGVEVTSSHDGVLDRVEVRAGDHVRRGDVVARLRADAERNDVALARREFEARLALRLANPASPDLEAHTAEARIALDRARARLAERRLVASRDGVIGDVHLESGQPVSAGQTVATLLPRDGDLVVRAVIPAHHRPALRIGQRVRLEVGGYPYTYEQAEVTFVGERVAGPSEIRAALGRSLAEVVDVSGPAILVEARLPRESFEVDGVRYAFHGGMTGQVEIAVGDEPALFVLVPPLRKVFEP